MACLSVMPDNASGVHSSVNKWYQVKSNFMGINIKFEILSAQT